MIPGLPNWSDTDNVPKDYHGPRTPPPLKGEWGPIATVTLGPMDYGDITGGMAQKWWAIHTVVSGTNTLLFLAEADHTGVQWKPSRFLAGFDTTEPTLRLSACFDSLARIVVALGTANTFTLGYVRNGTLIKVPYPGIRRGIVANEYPFDDKNKYPVSVFYIGEGDTLQKDFLYQDTITPGGSLNSERTQHRQLGATWELLHGGYRMDSLFQIAYKHAPGDGQTLPSSPPPT